MRTCITIAFLFLVQAIVAQDSLNVFLKNLNRTNDTVYIAGCCKIAEEYSNLKNIKLAFSYMDSALIRAETLQKPRWVGYVYNIKGNLCSYVGSFGDALDCFDKALIVYRKAHYVDGEINVFVNRGNIYYGNGEFKRAEVSYRNAEQLYSKSRKDEVVLANIYNNLGGVFGVQEEYAKAETFFNKALKLYVKNNDSLSCAYIYNNLANIEQSRGNLQASFTLFTKALELKKTYGTNQETAVAWRNLAQTYMLLEEDEKALDCMEACLKLTDTTLFNSQLTLAYTQFARIYEKLGNYREATVYYKKLQEVNSEVVSKEMAEQSSRRDMLAEFTKVHLADSLIQANRIVVQNSEIRRSHTIRYSLIIVVVSTLVFLLVLYKRFRQSQSQKKEIQLQKSRVDEKQKEIMDSLAYAKNIQDALLGEDDLKAHTKDYFVFFKPKDIVSGDFYWTHHSIHSDDLFFVAVCDSTGHGVPGAFMSILNTGFLNEAIGEKHLFSPDRVFDYVRRRLIEVIKKDAQKDGFDGILLCFNRTQRTISYAAANNHPFIIRNHELIELAYDKMPVGKGSRVENFKQYTIDWMEGDTVYLITDGYADQFGGGSGKKLKTKNLKANLLEHAHRPLAEQKKNLEQFFDTWKGNLEQVDDVTVIAIRL